MFAIAENCEIRTIRPMDADWIKRGLKKPGKTQRGLAKALNLDPAAISRLLKGDRQLKASEITRVEAYLGDDSIGRGFESPAHTFRIPDITAFNRDLPVYEGALCGEDGAFEFESQRPSDFAPRPPRLSGVETAYALYVMSDSMVPWREPGQLVYVNPAQPARTDDYVVIQLQPKPGAPIPAYIKRLISRSQKELKALQYNPRKMLTFQQTKIVAVHRIMEWTELLGA